MVLSTRILPISQCAAVRGGLEEGVTWNQPPGTPAVGGAFLRLYEFTRDPRWIAAAGAAAHNMVDGQLLSGGWYNFTETAAQSRARWCYRSTVENADECAKIEDNKERNNGTLDDNITQSSLGFLMWYDEVAEGQDAAVRGAVEYGLDQLLAASISQWSMAGLPGPRISAPTICSGVAREAP